MLLSPLRFTPCKTDVLGLKSVMTHGKGRALCLFRLHFLAKIPHRCLSAQLASSSNVVGRKRPSALLLGLESGDVMCSIVMCCVVALHCVVVLCCVVLCCCIAL